MLSEKNSWLFGTEKRTADKSFQLTPSDKLDVHIEAKWSTLRDWMEASYILNGKVISTSKFSTITYAISSSENKEFLNSLTETLNIKNNPARSFIFKESFYEDFLTANLGLIKVIIPLCKSSYFFEVHLNFPFQEGWKTKQPVLPELDKEGKSKEYSSVEETLEACKDYLNKLFNMYL